MAQAPAVELIIPVATVAMEGHRHLRQRKHHQDSWRDQLVLES